MFLYPPSIKFCSNICANLWTGVQKCRAREALEKSLMNNIGSFKVTTLSDREIRMTRVFDAARHLVFDALTKPALVKQWLLGPPGWTMPICEIDLSVGGAYRFLWRDSDGTEMGTRCLPRNRAARALRRDRKIRRSLVPGRISHNLRARRTRPQNHAHSHGSLRIARST
jgi:hypothetical protein